MSNFPTTQTPEHKIELEDESTSATKDRIKTANQGRNQNITDKVEQNSNTRENSELKETVTKLQRKVANQ